VTVVPRFRWASKLAAGTTLVILLVTLVPGSQSVGGPARICLMCTDYALADALRNLVLFVPFGMGLVGSGWALRRVVLLALLLSASVELAQVFLIPGRDANPTDILSNSLGAAIGGSIVRAWPLWGRPVGKRATVLAIVALLVGVTVLLGSLMLLRIAPTDGVYYGQWTAELRNMEQYRGAVLGARIGDREVSSGRQIDSPALRDRLMGREDIVIRAIAGPAPRNLAPVFSIADHLQRQVLIVGIDDSDLIYQPRMVATDARLDQPYLRAERLLDHVEVGDTVEIALRWTGETYCFSVDEREACGIGVGIGRGWSVLEFSDGVIEELQPLLDLLWLALLFLPMGYWAATLPRAVALLVPLAAAFLVVAGWPVIVGFLDFGGAAAGAGIGLLLRRKVARGSAQ
jgi:VanZ like family